MQPHRQFFTSLKHLEKRLKLENHPPPPPSSALPPPTTANTQQSEPLGTPIYLHSIGTATNAAGESEAPNEFLTASSPDSNSSRPEFDGTVDEPEKSSLDCDVENLMQLLGLSETGEGEGIDDVVGCDEGFYGKIVGVKGPKSVKEVERMNGWIEYFLKGEKKEVLGLAHLLLGKAAFVHSGGDDNDHDHDHDHDHDVDDDDGFGIGEFVFPSTIDEFLRNDPPLN